MCQSRVEKSELQSAAFFWFHGFVDISATLSFQFKTALDGEKRVKDRGWPFGDSEKSKKRFQQKAANWLSDDERGWLMKSGLNASFIVHFERSRVINSRGIDKEKQFQRHCITAASTRCYFNGFEFFFWYFTLMLKPQSWGNTQPVWMCVRGAQSWLHAERFNFRFRFRAIAI